MTRTLGHFRIRGLLPLVIGVVTASFAAVGHIALASAQTPGRGTIKGHIRLLGKLPGNPVIRMRRDPLCAKINNGKQVVQETVVAALDGSLANVFVRLQGTFPDTPVPTQPVTIDQRGCIYGPRVVGLRVGQVLQVRNSDELLHNVHSASARTNNFNIGQPMAGMVYQFRPKDEETMLRLSCDLHSWMTAFIGIVNHPYFDVTATNGMFEIKNAPPGRHTIQAWHEQYGDLKQTVLVTSGATATVDFNFSGTAQTPQEETGGLPAARGAVR
jgi:hypothetical protein